MTTVSTMTTKGQVTIPKQVRDLLGLVPGSKLDFRRTADGRIELRPVDGKMAKSVFAKLRGHAKGGRSTDEIMALTRGEA